MPSSLSGGVRLSPLQACPPSAPSPLGLGARGARLLCLSFSTLWGRRNQSMVDWGAQGLCVGLSGCMGLWVVWGPPPGQHLQRQWAGAGAGRAVPGAGATAWQAGGTCGPAARAPSLGLGFPVCTGGGRLSSGLLRGHTSGPACGAARGLHRPGQQVWPPGGWAQAGLRRRQAPRGYAPGGCSPGLGGRGAAKETGAWVPGGALPPTPPSPSPTAVLGRHSPPGTPCRGPRAGPPNPSGDAELGGVLSGPGSPGSRTPTSVGKRWLWVR